MTDYRMLNAQLPALISGASHRIANLADAALPVLLR